MTGSRGQVRLGDLAGFWQFRCGGRRSLAIGDVRRILARSQPRDLLHRGLDCGKLGFGGKIRPQAVDPAELRLVEGRLFSTDGSAQLDPVPLCLGS